MCENFHIFTFLGCSVFFERFFEAVFRKNYYFISFCFCGFCCVNFVTVILFLVVIQVSQIDIDLLICGELVTINRV